MLQVCLVELVEMLNANACIFSYDAYSLNVDSETIRATTSSSSRILTFISDTYQLPVESLPLGAMLVSTSHSVGSLPLLAILISTFCLN